jgi:hypothetical protein
MSDPKITLRNCIFAYKCSAKWNNLTPTENLKINFCQQCQKEVHFCESDEELISAIRLNRCVAFYSHEYGSEYDILLGDVIPRSGRG